MKALLVFKDGHRQYIPQSDCRDSTSHRLLPEIKLVSRLPQVKLFEDHPLQDLSVETMIFRLRRFSDGSFQYEEV